MEPGRALNAASWSMRAAAAAVGRLVRRAPVTTGFLAAVLTVVVVLHTLDGADRARVVLAASTNLPNLADRPVEVLVASAFVVTGVTGLVPFAVIGGTVERRLGRAAVVRAFVVGHVGATLLTAMVLVVGVRFGLVGPGVVDGDDVGISYGMLALAGVLVPALSPRLRTVLLVGVAGFLARGLFGRVGVADVGHPVAFALGLLLAAAAPDGRPPGTPVGAAEPS